MRRKTGIIITNTGTPDAPTTAAVRRYLREFLSDKRVVKIPRLIWLPILYLFILTLRPRKSAALYQKIWAANDSPMRLIMQSIRDKLQQKCSETNPELYVEFGMNYGRPSIPEALTKLRSKNIDKLIVIPLFPQYSNSTTASSYDRLQQDLKTWPSLPSLNFIREYSSNHLYISALAESVREFWRKHGTSEHLLISFHGLPKRFAEAGDPYPLQCEQTAQLLADALQLAADKWTLCYQSQFGYDKWLQPSTQVLFKQLPKQGIYNIDVICPGFSADCLETLEEIAIRGKNDFIASGGRNLRLIPSLNDNTQHIDILNSLIDKM
ncbi:MAG TPA: ferrochelatase [Gammaproteobacteria bacterium]|jgi:ferrochelatase|nr:ferrochelatase [Gammaproteobacteria bacterium]